MTELKKCKCGSDNLMIGDVNDMPSDFPSCLVMCLNCFAVTSEDYENEAMAAEAWNGMKVINGDA